MRAVDKQVVWFDCGFLPLAFGFTRSEKAYEAAIKRLGIEQSDGFGMEGAGAVTHVMRRKDGQLPSKVCIVTTHVRKITRAQLAATLAHEAVHVWQVAKEAMRQEGDVGDEVEAYAIQYFTQCLVGQVL